MTHRVSLVSLETSQPVLWLVNGINEQDPKKTWDWG